MSNNLLLMIASDLFSFCHLGNYLGKFMLLGIKKYCSRLFFYFNFQISFFFACFRSTNDNNSVRSSERVRVGEQNKSNKWASEIIRNEQMLEDECRSANRKNSDKKKENGRKVMLIFLTKFSFFSHLFSVTKKFSQWDFPEIFIL